jgi:hypothetical protein
MLTRTGSNRTQTTRAGVLAAVAVLFACFVFDPYSYGSVGGDRQIWAFHAWQVAVTLIQAGLLIGALVWAGSSRAARLLTLEMLLFSGVNAIYILRDGMYVRGSVGNYSYYLPAVLVMIGLATRIALLTPATRRRVN